MTFKQYYGPFFISASIAVLGLVFYLLSGNSELDKNLGELSGSGKVDQITTESKGSEKYIEIKCDDGTAYKYLSTQEEINLEAIRKSRCK